MITDKEYPATHSMATSWYCVDEDGNVGIFDIDDNGPVPVGEYRQNCVDEVFYEDFTFDEAQFKRLHLSPDQISQMLEPMDMKDVWEESVIDNGQINVSWMDVIVQIDMDKFDIFKKAHELDASPYHPLVCLSEELGLFYAVIVKTCSDIFYTIEQKKCPIPSAKIRNYSHSHKLMSQ